MYTPSQALRSYQQVGAAAQVAAADDPVKLIQLLMAKAVEQLTQLSRAVAIIDTLNSLVDLDKGGEIGRNLRDLYDYATQRVTYANLKNDARALDEATNVIREIKAGWDGIAAQPRPAAVVP
jgi:flagellar protein FliS